MAKKNTPNKKAQVVQATKQLQKKQDKKTEVVKKTIVKTASKKNKEVQKVVAENTEVVDEQIQQQVLSFKEIQDMNEKKIQSKQKVFKAEVKLDQKQLKSCVTELINYYQKKVKNASNVLFQDDDFVYLEIVVNKVPEEYSIRPQQIRLPNPIYGEQYQTRSCVFSSDPQRAFKDKIMNLELESIAKVVGYEKIFKKYPQYVDKRQLCNDYDLFFTDYTIYPLLPKALGKIFYERKKIPFPINCSGVPDDLKERFGIDYQAYLNDLNSHTYFIQGNGPSYSFKVARVDMSVEQIVENVQAVLLEGVARIFKDEDNISLHMAGLRTHGSISLPFLNVLSKEDVKAYFKK